MILETMKTSKEYLKFSRSFNKWRLLKVSSLMLVLHYNLQSLWAIQRKVQVNRLTKRDVRRAKRFLKMLLLLILAFKAPNHEMLMKNIKIWLMRVLWLEINKGILRFKKIIPKNMMFDYMIIILMASNIIIIIKHIKLYNEKLI